MLSCESCGTRAPDGALFCAQCGARLSPGLSPQTMSALRRSERKIVTILFADIKGSLALVAGQDPELAGEVLSVVVACMTEAVRRHGGLVNQVMGDGIMALFGAPIAIEDHAAQACLAALSMRVAIRDQVRPRVSLRVGLGTGEVVVRAVPGDVGLHYSGAGEAVHLASRMEQAAGPDEILLTEETRVLAGSVIETLVRHDVVLKGMTDAVPVHELVGTRRRVFGGGAALLGADEAMVGSAPAGAAAAQAGPARAGATRAVSRGGRSRSMVGRERELEVLRGARDRAAAGEGQAVRLVGEAGSGKSRLLREFTASHLQGEWRLCQSEAVPHRRTSYGVVTDLLSGVFGLAGEDTAAERREKVAAGLDVTGGEREAALAPLSALLNLESLPPGWIALDAWERRERTIAATVQAFQRAAVRQPVTVVVEDAHWLDAESATSIQRLGATAAGRRLLAVVTQRVAPHGGAQGGAGSEDGPDWREARWIECAVRPLDEASTLSFLRGRMLPGHDVEALERRLIEHTSGNPLFLEECLQALVETGALVRVGDRLRLERPVSVLQVPSSVRGLLDARVDRLPDAEKDVLQAAAVVGSTVPMDLLASATGLDESALQGALSRLVEAGFLVERDQARTRVAFRHGLIREAAYHTILRRTRVRMHGAVLDALERRPGGPEPIVDLLADHAMLAEAWPKAVTYSRRAAVRAYERYANPEAVQYYDRALQAAEALPAGETRDETLLKLRIGVRFPLFRLGRVASLGPHLDEAVRLAGLKMGGSGAGQGRHEELAQAHVMRSHVHWLRGEPQGALADADAAAALAREHGDAELAVRARFQRGLVWLTQSDVAGTLSDMQAVLNHLGPRPAPGRYGLDDRLMVNAYAYMARAHAAAGALGAARAACDAGLGMAQAIQERQTLIYAHLADSVVSLAEGRAERAVLAAGEADALCRGADVRLLSPVAAGCLAQAYVAAGRAARALPIAQQAVEDGERMGFLAMQSQRLLVLAETLIALDRGQEAEEAARGALTMARATGEQGTAAGALGLLAAAAGRRGEEEAAARQRQEARAIAGRLGLAPLLRVLGGAGLGGAGLGGAGLGGAGLGGAGLGGAGLGGAGLGGAGLGGAGIDAAPG